MVLQPGRRSLSWLWQVKISCSKSFESWAFAVAPIIDASICEDPLVRKMDFSPLVIHRKTETNSMHSTNEVASVLPYQ